MNLSNLPSSVSIIILNSSHPSVDDVTSVLKTQIDSGQRPYVCCLRGDEIEAASPGEFMKTFVATQSEKCAIAIEKSRQLKDFNQLDDWKRELEMKTDKKTKRRSTAGVKVGIKSELNKTRRDCTQSIIIDFPLDNDAIKLYLILFDVYDCELIKSVLAFDSSLKAIVNLHPRIIHDQEPSIKAEFFWSELLRLKNTKAFESVAFLDLDVPVEPRFMLQRRSRLIYDQFCHFFYDIEDIKSSFVKFRQQLEIVGVEINGKSNDMNELAKRLDEIPESMLTVDAIYDAIMSQVCNENGNRKSSRKTSKSSIMMENSKQPFKVELFTKNFTDANDALGKAFNESPEVYAANVAKLENSLHFWDGVDQVSLEKRQLLNYFMKKLLEKLELSGSSEHLEFCIYSLQFRAMKRNLHLVSRNFYEVRSVSQGKTSTEAEILNIPFGCMKPVAIKRAISDCHVDYMNRSNIPEEISHLVGDTEAIHGFMHNENFVQMLSSSAMIQRLAFLIESHPSFTSQHSELLDVLLINFHRKAIPQMFSTKTYSKILPTPLCFRDFNDFEKPKMKPGTNEQIDLEMETRSSEIKLQEFFLATSIKHKQWSEGGYSAERNSIVLQTENVAQESVEKDVRVFDVSNRRIQFHLTESEFNSVHIAAKASNFHWLHRQRILDFSCRLHDVSLSLAHDLDANNLLFVTVADSDGIKCSLDKTTGTEPSFLKRWNFLLSLPNGAEMRNLGDKAVEQTWMEGKSLTGERKRVSFSNGFLLIESSEGVVKILAWNGTIFQMNVKIEDFGREIQDKSASDYAEATKLHIHSIDSIQFVKEFVDLSSYLMVLPNGERFAVERNSITKIYERLQDIEKYDKATGNLHIVRADGVKMLHKKSHSKVLFADGTTITTWKRDDSTATATDEVELNESILEKIWSSESENESKFVVNQVLAHITDDYFLNIKFSHQFEHKHCGAVRFDGDVSFEFFNGATLTAGGENFSLNMGNCASLLIDDLHLQVKGKKCSECCSFCEVFMKFPLENADEEYTRLLSARDFHGNAFEIKQDGRHAFYVNDSYDIKLCPQCSREQEQFEARNYGERHIVLNRDYSGYELSPFREERAAFSETIYEVLLFNDPETIFCYKLDVADVDIDLNVIETPPVMAESVQDTASSVSTEKSAASVESVGRRKSKKASKRGSTVSKISKQSVTELEMSPWLTTTESIFRDISAKHAKLIQFYANPLEDIPASSVAVGAMIKLNNRINLVTDAVLYLKNYSPEKLIFNARGLIEAPTGKKEFEDNFKLVVCKTIEDFVRGKLELMRQSNVADVINVLLYNSVKTDEDLRKTASIDSDSVHSVYQSAVTIPVKSFSFI